MQHYTHTRTIQNASHYDGLSGAVEDLMAMAVGAVASQAPTVEEAFNLFRFNKAKIERSEVLSRIRTHDVTPAFNVAYEAIKVFVVPPAVFTAPKDMKPDEQIKVHDDLFNKFKDAYKKLPASAKAPAALPPAPSTGFRNFTVPRGPLGPLTSRFSSGTADTRSDTPPAASAFPIVPVAIVAVGLGAFLLMRKK